MYLEVVDQSSFGRRDPGTDVVLWTFRNFQEHLLCEKKTNSCFCTLPGSFIWFNCIRIINKRNAYKFQLKFVVIFNYLLFNTSACADHFCDKNVSRILILHLVSFAVWKQSKKEWWQYFLVKEFMDGEKYSYIIYILYACFGIPK